MHDGSWAETRRRQTEFVDRTPTVLVVGAGHTGLEIAARLKYIGVDALVVEKNARIGDNVRGPFFVSASFVRWLM
jgi:heterodisulfide reductase subunit A-like polyferredoxin